MEKSKGYSQLGQSLNLLQVEFDRAKSEFDISLKTTNAESKLLQDECDKKTRMIVAFGRHVNEIKSLSSNAENLLFLVKVASLSANPFLFWTLHPSIKKLSFNLKEIKKRTKECNEQ